jgi:hypothetical protein
MLSIEIGKLRSSKNKKRQTEWKDANANEKERLNKIQNTKHNTV